MISFLKQIFSVNNSEASKNLVEYIKDTSELSKEINQKKQEMHHMEYKNFLENKDEMFIPLSNFMELIETPNISMDTIVSKCKHISEINKMRSSTIDVFSIIEDDHVVLCPDVNNCKKHKGHMGDKIKITTIRS